MEAAHASRSIHPAEHVDLNGRIQLASQGYPYLNFMLCTALYVLVSLRLFKITNNLKNYLLPLDDHQSLFINSSLLAGFGLTCFVLAKLYTLV
jgi:hypothetical protein